MFLARLLSRLRLWGFNFDFRNRSVMLYLKLSQRFGIDGMAM